MGRRRQSVRQHRGSVHIVMGRVRHHSVRGRHIGEGIRGRVGERQSRAWADRGSPALMGPLHSSEFVSGLTEARVGDSAQPGSPAIQVL